MGRLEDFLEDLGTMVDQQARIIDLLAELKVDSAEQKEVLHRTFALLDQVVGVYLNSLDRRR